MKIWKRLLGLALYLCAAACVLCVGASAEDHSHYNCGVAGCTENHGHSQVTEWTELTQTAVTNGELKLTAGNSYYLGEDISVKYTITINGTVNLCLNGYSITKTTESDIFRGVIKVYENSKFTLCNCKIGGTITHASGVTGRGVHVGTNNSHYRTTSFIMYGGTISGNRVTQQDGAGVDVQGAFFQMYGGEISDNHVETTASFSGGGVHTYSSGCFIMYGGTINGNTVTNGNGGGVDVVGASFEMRGGTITGNTADNRGGGLALYNSTFTLSDGEISNNKASNGNGGGVYFSGYTDSNTLIVSDTVKIEGNSAVDGGGIYINSYNLTVTGGSISNNTATGSGGGVYFNGDTFQVSGRVSIAGNKKGGTFTSSGLTGGTDNNVYLSNNKYITVANPLTGPVIGVTTEAAPSDSAYVRIAMGHKLCATPDKFHYENDDTSISAVTSGNTATLVACVHNWSGTWSTDDSNHWHECSICKGKTDVAVHAYDQEVVNEIYKASGATCTAKATYYKSCVCGKMGTETFEIGELLAHDFVGGAWQSDADHHWKKCSRCEATDTPNPHEWGSGTVTKAATCMTAGERTYTCSVCSATRTETIDAKGHDYSRDWTTDADHHWHKCTNCDAVDAKANHSGGTANCKEKAVCEVCGTAYGEPDASNHDWGEWAATTPATTSATGVETRTCTRDASHTETRDIPKLTPAPSGGSSAPTITVPVTGSRDTVQVSASVSNGTAEVAEIKKSELDKIGTDRDMVIDLSGLSKRVTGVTLPTDTIRSISESEADGVTIKLPNAELRVDQQTLAAVSEQAKGSKVQLVVETDSKAKSTMTAAQKQALDGMKNAAALEAYFVSNGTRIRDFNGGEVELSIPYQASGAIRAWYLKEDGTREPVSARYDKENARLILRHFSHYVIEELDGSTAYTVCAKDNTCPLAAFGDLTATAWYHDGVHYCLENGLMQGVSTARFLPDGSTTRAQLVTILWRLEGSPETTGAVSFGDVADGAWYAEAVRWAAGSGVVKGYDSERFGPDDAVTREQMVTILYRYAQYKGYDVSVGEDTNILSFADAMTASEYAIPAMQWACGSGLVTGIAREGGTFLAPADTTVRVQTATLMIRFPGALVKTA